MRHPAILLLAGSLAGSLACQPKQPRSDSPTLPTASDTLRGVFVLEGSDPSPSPVLRTLAGRVVLDGAPREILALSQLELRVRGTSLPDGHFAVVDFVVRRANGREALDGMLQARGDGFALSLPDGSMHALRGTPPQFTQLVGRRIWLTETSAGTVADYGII